MKRGPGFLNVVFRVAHACPKSKYEEAPDYITFELTHTYEDQWVFECPKCKQTACIDFEVKDVDRPKPLQDLRRKRKS